MDKIEREYAEEVGKAVRKEFVRQVTDAIEQTPRPVTPDGGSLPQVFPKQEQAQVLRRIADNLEKSDEREGVLKQTRARLHDKNPPLPFFTRIGNWRNYWDGRGHEPVARKDWVARVEKTQATASPAPQDRNGLLKDRAAEVQPMKFFAATEQPRTHQTPAEIRAAHKASNPETPGGTPSRPRSRGR